MSDLVGETVGAYRITERLGRGGMADVYKAFHTALEVHRAVKFIRPEFVTSDDFKARFQKEAQGVARLSHPNIVQIHDFGEEDNRYYMVMEFVAGETLKERLQRGGAMPIDETVRLVEAVAGALKYAHERDLIHRDIKPDNIMIDGDGRPVLMDFGIAKLLTTETQLTQTGMGIGTPAYMAPEQAKGLEVGPPADIYALSIVLFEMLTGRVPFSADTPMAVMLKALSDPLPMPREINPDISEPLQAVILKGTAKEPEHRYATVDDFLAGLKNAMAGVPPADEAPTVVRPSAAASTAPPAAAPASEPPRKKRPVALMAGIAAVLLLGAGWWLMSGSEPDEAGAEVSDAAGVEAAGATAEPADGPAMSTQTSPAPTMATQPATVTTSRPAASPAATPAATSFAPAATERPVAYAYRDEIGADEIVRTSVALEAGEHVFLNVYSADVLTDFTLMAPDGRKEVFRTYADKGPLEIKTSGNHEFFFASRREESGEVDVELLRLKEAGLNGGVLQPGQFFAGTTRWPGEWVEGTVSLTRGQTVFFDVTRSEVTTDFWLTEPDGRKDLFKSYSDSGPIEVRQTGVHRWVADPRADKAADFEFNLYVVDPPIVAGGAVEFGGFTAGATEIPGQVVEYGIDLNAGDTIYFDVLEASVTTDFLLTAPDGRTQIFKTYGDRGPETLRDGGRYVLRADPRSDKLSEYEFTLHRLDPATIVGGEIGVDQYVKGSTSQPGQQIVYQLNLPSGGPWRFELVERPSATTDFRLNETTRRKKFMDSYSTVKSFEVPAAGRYELTADPRAAGVTEFEFRVIKAEP